MLSTGDTVEVNKMNTVSTLDILMKKVVSKQSKKKKKIIMDYGNYKGYKQSCDAE